MIRRITPRLSHSRMLCSFFSIDFLNESPDYTFEKQSTFTQSGWLDFGSLHRALSLGVELEHISKSGRFAPAEFRRSKLADRVRVAQNERPLEWLTTLIAVFSRKGSRNMRSAMKRNHPNTEIPPVVIRLRRAAKLRYSYRQEFNFANSTVCAPRKESLEAISAESLISNGILSTDPRGYMKPPDVVTHRSALL